MSEPFATSDAIAKAKEWLDAASPRWRLQTMQHRSRYDPETGEYRQLPTRVRRFLNGTPSGMKAAVLQVLRESAPYKSPVFDLECDGLEYVPTNTFIRKDGAEHVTNAKDATYTIIQDLRLADGLLDRFSFADESSCSQAGETEYRWDEPDVEPCPDGSQGVVYQVSDVSRDRESDLFSYRLRRVQALTQHMPPSVSQCDARKTVTVETWNNVYGEPGSFRWDPVKGGSAPIRFPEPCSQADGTAVQVDVAENPDCTFRVEVRTVVARADEGRFSVYLDQYKAQRSDAALNAAAPLPRRGTDYAVVEVDGQFRGRMTKCESTRNEDGTWNNETTVEEERPVPGSSFEERRLPRHVVRTVVDTNQRDPASAVPSKYGSYKSAKTPGGLYVNEYVEYVRRAVDRLGILCTDTAFAKTHETQSSVTTAVPSGHVPAARNGVVTTWNYDTDAEGSVTRRVRTDSEHDVRDAVRRVSRGWLGTESGRSHRSVPKSVADRLVASAARGERVEARLTPGAMWDVDVSSFSPAAGVRLSSECSATVYQHAHSLSASGLALDQGHASAGGGVTQRLSSRLDPSTGSVTDTLETVQEVEVPGSRRSVRVTARGTVVRVSDSNAPAPFPDASSAGETTESEVTPGGRYNRSRESVKPRMGPLGDMCSRDRFLHSDGVVRTVAARQGAPHSGGSGGTYREMTQRLGDDGLWEVQEVEHRELPVRAQRVEQRATRTALVTRTTDMQVVSPGTPLGSGSPPGSEHVAEVTKGGLYNVTDVAVAARPGALAQRCEKDAFLHTTETTTARTNAPSGDEHVAGGSGGLYREKSYRLGDDGAWEMVDAEHEELQQGWKEREYRDAFGATDVSEEMSSASMSGTRGGASYEAERLVRHVESQMTKGGRYNVRTTEEKPTPLSSGWLHFDKSTSKGLACYYDFIVFRNQRLEWVRTQMQHLKAIEYRGDGEFQNHPSLTGISPNKFGLWDGSLMLTTTFTPKAWSPGGNTEEDNFSDEYTVVDASVTLLNSAQSEGNIYLLVAFTRERHRRGAGVGRRNLERAVSGSLVRGSQFSYHPSGQVYSYDLIVSRSVEYRVQKASDGINL